MTDLSELFKQIAKPAATSPISWLVVGLGNPGSEYENTRHNAGFAALDAVAEAAGATVNRLRFRALTGEAVISGERVLLCKPQTFMNLSGEAVGEAAAFYRIPPEHILVMCDDIHFAPGIMRIRRQGSHGGHNGLRDIVRVLGSDAFPRIKLGVGEKPSPEYDLANWVLGKLGKQEKEALQATAKNASAAVSLWIAGKQEEAMSRYSK